MESLEKPGTRDFPPVGATSETAAFSLVGGLLGLVIGRMMHPSLAAATIGGLIGAAVGVLARLARRELALAQNPEPDLISDVVCYLSEHLGPEMTAFVGGAESPAVVSRWISGDVLPKPLERDRLKTARQAVEELAGAYSDGMIKSWFLGMNEWLGDRAPALILRQGQQPDDWSAVLPAAEEFAESAY